ncbi:hypothetical protein ACJMK2_028249 [Sinanodonta woodiana]|uniref:BTB domain-containing protein n=1 Tax=Sinanodonta woodiana TaxID=1069815 RepID=A0ABD3XA09_SINWO
MSLSKKCKYGATPSFMISEGFLTSQDITFTTKSQWTDLQLKVEDKELYVPKSHLAMVSPVFRQMFESDFKEKDRNVLPLPGKTYEDVLTFLKCTHPGNLQKITYDIVPKVLPLAHEYQVKWIIDDCVKAMMMEMDTYRFVLHNSRSLAPRVSVLIPSSPVLPLTKTDLYTNCCNICIMAERYNLCSLIETFIERFSTLNYKCYKDLSEFKQISVEVRYKIVCARLASKEDP